MVFRSGRLAAAGLLSMSCTFALADVAERLDAYLAGLDSVSSRFEQRVFDEQRNLLERSIGTFLIDRPGRFRFEYSDPPQIIVGDGSRIWIYDPELAQVTVTDMEAALGSTPAVLLTSERPVEDWFRITKVDAREGLDVFVLEPKREDAVFTRIGLAFLGGELRRMELLDQFGQTSLISFDDVQRLPAIPDRTFTFTPPAGVDVIDADE